MAFLGGVPLTINTLCDHVCPSEPSETPSRNQDTPVTPPSECVISLNGIGLALEFGTLYFGKCLLFVKVTNYYFVLVQ